MLLLTFPLLMLLLLLLLRVVFLLLLLVVLSTVLLLPSLVGLVGRVGRVGLVAGLSLFPGRVVVGVVFLFVGLLLGGMVGGGRGEVGGVVVGVGGWHSRGRGDVGDGRRRGRVCGVVAIVVRWIPVGGGRRVGVCPRMLWIRMPSWVGRGSLSMLLLLPLVMLVHHNTNTQHTHNTRSTHNNARECLTFNTHTLEVAFVM